ncbi:hypothetical protein T440DRAFT_123474 [Plenodomus tracheiphilus IPT5]|uniref:Uncharacterized protein n=1 Tax=Plenodomus tracheiphilus IPT5 TaxID=1408161 RepID=A0A6A7B5E3_9PLEO|nr:hypothetical protein T440DRAFT_123474 [Plenodomus tracheiphilus IPT5]
MRFRVPFVAVAWDIGRAGPTAWGQQLLYLKADNLPPINAGIWTCISYTSTLSLRKMLVADTCSLIQVEVYAQPKRMPAMGFMSDPDLRSRILGNPRLST